MRERRMIKLDKRTTLVSHALKLSAYVLAALVPTIIAWLVSFRELTMATGYVTYPLQDRSLIPYRDYFDPVPPLMYFEAHITANAQFGLHNYMVLALLVVPVFGIACFSLARLFLGYLNSLLMVALMETLLVAERLEQVGGWNSQFFMLMAIGFVLFVYAVLNRMENGTNSSTNRLKAKILSILSGFALSLAMIEKQTCVLTIIIVIILLVPWMYWERREGFIRYILDTGVLCLVGALPVASFMLYFLVSSHALTPFAKDMLSGGGKNPQLTSFGSEAYHSITAYIPLSFMVAAACVLLLFYLWRKLFPGLSAGNRHRYLHQIQYYVLVFASSFLIWRFSGTYESSQTAAFLVCDAIVSILPVLIDHFGSGIVRGVKSASTLVIVLSLPVIFDVHAGGSMFDLVSRIGITATSQISLILLVIVLSLATLLPRRFQSVMSRRSEMFLNGSSLTFSQFKFIIVIANLFSLASFVNLFSSGGGIYIQWFIPQAVVYFSLLVLVCEGIARRFPLRNIAVLVLALVMVSTLVVTFNNPYNWFNWSEEAVFSAHTSSDLPQNFGFQLSLPESALYARIHSGALRAAKASGKGGDATVFSYPNIPTAATATGLKNYTAIKCSVLWFDTCPNEQAAADLVAFKMHPPNVIIWEPIPSVLMRANERTFVHGRSALEDWEIYRIHEVAAGRWRQIDKFVSPLSNGWTTYVYSVAGS